MEMGRNIASLLQIEGNATDQWDLDVRLGNAGLYTYAIDCGYYDAMFAVVGLYKPARAKRELVDGVNVNEESIAGFRFCANRFFEIANRMPDTPSIVKALVIHNAASCYGRATGNKPEDQELLNGMAMLTLHDVWTADESLRESTDSHTVYAKVAVGLYEQGSKSFEEAGYRALIDTMDRIGSKDAAGRRLFLARWLVRHGRHDDAIVALQPVEVAGYVSAPNQINEARDYLAELVAGPQ